MSAVLSGRRAVVTGAGRGIGRAITLDLAGAGVSVLAIARSEPDLRALAEEAGVEVQAADVRDAAAMERIVGSAEADLLVTAAGWNRPGPVTEVALEDLQAILEINVTGTLLACRAFGAAALAAGRTGAVVTISSQMGAVGYPGRVAYCASKHAVNGMTKALALEWAPAGIRVNSVAPTFIRTPLTEPFFEDPAFTADVLGRIPLGRIGEVGEVSGAVRFLLSEDASMITGHVLAVDGGWTAI
jgi:NAD(P)-dependent dehydrogenase (short-subunit alcohol dehydrogenase family)